MNRRFLVTLAAVALAGAALVTFIVSRPAPEPVETAVAPVVGPTPTPAPPPAPPAPAATDRTASAVPSRRAAPPPAAEIAAPAEAAPETATLNIDSDVPGAQVFLDRQFVGEAPAVASDVKPGSHVINVSAKGYDGVSTTLTVEPGPRDVVVKLREVRLDARLQVVHKHRMGSCTGQLVATPKGMRYETTDKDDAFTAALLDLETFEVDYLAKNLRIKSQKGKRYDFTDPDGNADRLFVFHRDVDKARERLKKGDPAAAQ
jgi:PEGA domain